MKVNNISVEELDKFSIMLEDNVKFKQTVKSLWQDNLSFPEWCFILEEKDQVIARIGYWSPSDNREQFNIFGLHLPWSRDDVQNLGQHLLNESLKQMRSLGAKHVEVRLDSENAATYQKNKILYESIGMQLIQEKKRFILLNKKSTYTNRLFYKSLVDVGEKKFVDIIKKVTRDTLDQDDQLAIVRFGEEGAATQYLHLLKDLDFRPNYWLVGYKENSIIGLVVPQKLSEKTGAINYIGVVPEKRGKGYVIDLLQKGIEILFDDDGIVEKIIADIDNENFPMEKALIKTGFIQENKVLVYNLNFENHI